MLEIRPIFSGKYSSFQLHVHSIPVYSIINPRHMREVYSSLCVCVCLSVTTLAATYLVFTSKIRCLTVHYGVFQICNMWLLPCSKVLASFADHRGLPHPLTSSRWTKAPAMASFQREECVQLVIASTTRLTHH